MRSAVGGMWGSRRSCWLSRRESGGAPPRGRTLCFPARPSDCMAGPARKEPAKRRGPSPPDPEGLSSGGGDWRSQPRSKGSLNAPTPPEQSRCEMFFHTAQGPDTGQGMPSRTLESRRSVGGARCRQAAQRPRTGKSSGDGWSRATSRSGQCTTITYQSTTIPPASRLLHISLQCHQLSQVRAHRATTACQAQRQRRGAPPTLALGPWARRAP